MIGLRASLASLLVAGGTGASLLFACGGAQFTTSASDGGGASTTDASTADAGTFCTTDGSTFDFCADFDEPLPGPWNGVNMPTGGATVAEDGTASTSPPSSLLGSAPEVVALDAGVHPTISALVTKIQLPKGGTHIQFDFRIDELSFPNANDSAASVVVLAYTQGSYGVYLAFRPVVGDTAPFGAWLLETETPLASGAPIATGLTSLQPLLSSVGTWTHVEIDFDIDNGQISLADGGVSVQGTVTVPGQAPRIVTMHPPTTVAKADRTLSVGVSSTATTGAAKVRFDNVTYSHLAP